LNFENQQNYNCEITTDQGNTYKVFGNWLHNQKLDHWTDWHCKTGVTRLYIDKNLQVFNGECSTQLLGHALSDFEQNEFTVCSRPTCTGCTDDLITEKYYANR
jgi:hypothetical protein